MFKNNLEFRKIAPQRNQLGIYKHRLAIKQIDLGCGHLAMHQQQQAFALHRFQRPVGFADIADTGVAIGGRAGRVELERNHAGILGAPDLVGRQIVSQVQRHQRLEAQTLGHGGNNPLAVGQRLGRSGHWRPQIGHDDGAAKLCRAMRHHGSQRLTIAQMQMPVVGSGQAQAGNRF